MLQGIPSLITPNLYEVLYDAGHGSVIVFADAFFPAHSQGPQVIEVPNLPIARILDSLLPFCPPDHVGGPAFTMMNFEETSEPEPRIAGTYMKVIGNIWKGCKVAGTSRHEFYTFAKTAFAIVKTTDETAWANIALRMGVPGFAQRV
jgi:L-fucose mutarotase